MVSTIIDEINRQNLRSDLPEMHIGDTMAVHVRIKEGDKERIQVYTGTLIARDGGSSTETITVRRVSHGVGVERVFPLHSPYLAQIEIVSSAHVRRAKLYYLRNRVGKKTRMREKIRG